ncbi:MAG: hypothetical protein K2G14_07035, partial [Ruminococcus sp.]|nr:hypothetical protein [Ruminococcus sp.]
MASFEDIANELIKSKKSVQSPQKNVNKFKEQRDDFRGYNDNLTTENEKLKEDIDKLITKNSQLKAECNHLNEDYAGLTKEN